MNAFRHGRVVVTVAVAVAAGTADAQRGALATTPVLPRKHVDAGVTVLEHDQGAFARATKLALVATPVTVAGGADGDPEYDLTRAHGVTLLADGRLASFATIGNKFLIFGADGRGQRSLGRTGGGPGEFMAPGQMIGIAADTMLIPDVGNHRLNWATADRGVIRSQSLDGGSIHNANAAGQLPGGRAVLYSSGLVQQGVRDSITRPPASVVLVTATGAVREIARVPDLELAMVETRYRGRQAMHAAVLRFTRTALVAVWDTLIVTAAGDGYRIDLRNADSKVTSRVVVAMTRRPVTQAMRNAMADAEIKSLRGPKMEQLIDAAESERLARENPSADSLPPYQSLFVSPNKTLWVVDYMAPGDTSWSATAFRTDGAIIGRLHASGNARPMAFGDDRVVLRSTDEDGVVSLRVHRIVVDPNR